MKSLILTAIGIAVLVLVVASVGAQVEHFVDSVDTSYGTVGCAYKP